MLRHLLILIMVVPCFAFATGESPDLEGLSEKGLVYVEQPDTDTVIKDDEVVLIPYEQRRGPWGFMIGVNYSNYVPQNYQPSFSNKKFQQVYGTAITVGMTEASVIVKRNFLLGSFGAELGAGVYTNNQTQDPNIPTAVYSVLNVTEIRLGGVYSLDHLSPDPLFVPYIAGGVYTFYYRENLGPQTFGGNTFPSPYVIAGMGFNVGYFDHEAARLSYEEGGVQSTFIFAEARKYFQSMVGKDPNFSNDVDFALGFRVEF